jgi:hypothetical protein
MRQTHDYQPARYQVEPVHFHTMPNGYGIWPAMMQADPYARSTKYVRTLGNGVVACKVVTGGNGARSGMVEIVAWRADMVPNPYHEGYLRPDILLRADALVFSGWVPASRVASSQNAAADIRAIDQE